MGVGPNNANTVYGIGSNPYEHMGAASAPLAGAEATLTAAQVAAVQTIAGATQVQINNNADTGTGAIVEIQA